MKITWVLPILPLQFPIYNYFKMKVKKNCMFYFSASYGNLKKTQMPNVLFGEVVPVILKIIFY